MRNYLFLLLCSAAMFASETEFNEVIISELVANDPICVRTYVGDRIYLKPERIIPTQRGLFVHLDKRNYLPLSRLFSDQDGCYIHSSRSIRNEIDMREPTCPNGHIGIYRVRQTWYCNEESCPYFIGENFFH